MKEYKYFNIPEACNVFSTIFKKLFYENADLSTSDKELFSSVVNKITWLYSLKPNTINIKPYKDEVRDYPEIEFLEVIISEDKKVKRIAEIIMRAIPYPMVVIFKLDDKVQLWAAHERINLNDSSLNTIEDFLFTSWLSYDDALFKRLDIRKMRFTNYYTLYSDIVDAISIYNAESIIGASTNLPGEKAREILNQVNSIDIEITALRSSIKKETQFNRKVELNIRIKQLEADKDRLIKEAIL